MERAVTLGRKIPRIPTYGRSMSTLRDKARGGCTEGDIPPRRRGWVVGALLVVATAGCADAPAMRDSATTSTGTSSPPDATGTSSGIADPDACGASQECETTGACVAPYDPGTVSPGASVCVATCIETDDLSRWCIDDQSCCDGLRCNEVDGFCLPYSSTSGSSSTPSTSGSGTETSTGSTGTSSTAGSDTGTSSTGADTDGTSTSSTSSTSTG